MSSEKITFAIDGMHCEACVRRVTQALTRSGATVDEVTVGKAKVTALPAAEAGLLAALDKAGFAARVQH